jgi:hypothetical protein
MGCTNPFSKKDIQLKDGLKIKRNVKKHRNKIIYMMPETQKNNIFAKRPSISSNLTSCGY